MCSTINTILRERYRVAKLTLFNARLLNELQESQSEEIHKLIEDEAKRNGFISPPSLLHQGTFLSMAYICLVWLWESMKKAGSEVEDKFWNEFPKLVDRFDVNLSNFGKICGPRQVTGWPELLHLIRNALSHGKVEINDRSFVLSDQNERKKETDPTAIELTWEELAKLSEICIYALTPVLWPSSSGRPEDL